MSGLRTPVAALLYQMSSPPNRRTVSSAKRSSASGWAASATRQRTRSAPYPASSQCSRKRSSLSAFRPQTETRPPSSR